MTVMESAGRVTLPLKVTIGIVWIVTIEARSFVSPGRRAAMREISADVARGGACAPVHSTT